MGRGSSRKRRGPSAGQPRGGSSARGAGDDAPDGGGGGGGGAGADEPAGRGDGQFSRLHLWQVQIVRDLLLVGLLILIVWIGYTLRAVTVPLLVALLLAYLFEPLVARIARTQRFSREGAVVAILSTGLALVILLGGLVTPLVVQQTAQLIGFVRSDRVEQAARELFDSAPRTPAELLEQVREFVGAGEGEGDDEGDGEEAGTDGAATDGAAANPEEDGGATEQDGAASGGGGEDVSDPAATGEDGAASGREGEDASDPASTAAADGGGEVGSEPGAAGAPAQAGGDAPDAPDAPDVADEIDALLVAVDDVLRERALEPLDAAERERIAAAARGEDDLAASLSNAVRAMLDEREAAAGAAAAATAGAERVAADGPGVDYVGLVRNSVARLTGFLGAVVQLGLVAFLIPFYFYFFSVSWPRILAFGHSLVPDRHRDRTLELVGRMDEVVASFVRGRIVISLIMGVLFAIGWWICGVPYAIPVGIVVGIFSAVPYLGGVGIPLAVGLLLFEQLTQPGGRDMAWWLILGGPVLVFIIVQVIESYGLTPIIAGRATNLDPVTILVAVLAGGSVLGVYGMLLAIPAAACGKILIMEMVLPKIEAWKRGERADPLPLDR